MIDWPGQLHVSEMPRVALIVQIAHSWVVRTAVDGLPVDLGFVTGHAGRDFFAVHGDRLGYGILAEFVRVGDSELEFFDSAESDCGMAEVCGYHPEGGGGT
mmetsp:Transcript_34581/g.40025  ORF Transcript_34581/g.40025 Transcript_34581/m.40025 type:complete len:101 (+) Transcript_34581:889-1191(+)